MTKNISTVAIQAKALLQDTRKLRCALNNLCVTIANTLSQQQFNQDYLPNTKYHCGICGCSLVIIGRSDEYIFYQCLGCNKIYKARKNKILGRFQRR